MDKMRGRMRDVDEGEAAAPSFELTGQARVYDTWAQCAAGRPYINRAELNMARIAPEMAHVSVLSRSEEEGFRFRLAGSGLRQVFDCDARGRRISEVDLCLGDEAWANASNQALDDRVPLQGRTITDDGRIHYWLRLPMSSDGQRADMVLCHDRYLPLGAEDDPEAAAKSLDQALRLDADVAA